MKYVIYKIKPNKLETWKNWCRGLNEEYREEALKTVAHENYVFEGFGSFNVNGETFVIGYGLEAKGGAQKPDQNNLLNKKHSEMKKECLEFIDQGESDYFLSNRV